MELKSMMIFFIAYLLNLGLVIVPFYYGVVALWGPMLLKLTADLLLLAPSLSRFKRWALIRYVFHFELYFIGYVLLFPLLVLSRKKVIWKDRLLAEHTTVQR